MPASAQILCVAEQRGILCLWALVNPLAIAEKRIIRIAGTGHELPAEPGIYIGSVQLKQGALVFHVFESCSK